MTILDIILIALLGIGALSGFQQGLIVEVFSFLAFFLGLFFALELTIPVSVALFGSSSFFDIGAIVVFIALFILLSLAVKAGARAIKKAVDLTFLGSMDNLLGSAAGVLKWAFIISVTFWVFDSVGLTFVERYTDRSLFFPYIVSIGPVVFEWVSILLPFVKDLIDSMNDLTRENDAVIVYNSF